MDKLPLEILDNILFRLSIFQKQECMLVCRQWQQAINTRCLLHTVHIKDEIIMKRFINLVERIPAMRVQVECLTTNLYHPKLLQLFPNLRTVKININSSVYEDFADDEEEHVPNTRIFKIESIEDSEACTFTNTLLTHYNIGSCLHTLQLRTFWHDITCSDTLLHLKNLPVLKTLIIRGYLMTLNDCELIHNNLRLSSLSLLDITIKEDELAYPLIKPATSVNYLAIDMRDGSNVFVYKNWNTYICEKYTHLTELHYRLYDNHTVEEQVFESAYSILLKTFPLQLKSFRVNSVQSQLFSNSKLLDGFGCQLRHLEIQIHFENDNHDIFNILANSNQCEHIEELTIVGSVLQSFDGLEDLMHLKSLKLLTCLSEFYTPHIANISHLNPFLDLNSLLMHCPKSLISMYIHDCDLIFDTDAAIKQFQYANIKKLTLKEVHLTDCFDTFILTCLPYLNELTLIRTSGICILNLPNRHFKYLEISSTCFTVTLSNYTKPRFYHTWDDLSRIGLSKLGVEVAPLHKKLEHITDAGYDNERVDLICGSIDHFVIDDTPAVLCF